jgi:hypothetical protein
MINTGTTETVGKANSKEKDLVHISLSGKPIPKKSSSWHHDVCV